MRTASAFAAAALTSASLCACTPTVDGQAVSGPASHPSPPSGTFPDLAAFHTADIASYTSTNWHHDTLVSFRAAGDITCLANVYGQTTGVDGLGMIDCRGPNLPGFPDNAGGQDIARKAPAWETIGQSVRETPDGGFEFTYAGGGPWGQDHEPAELRPGQKLVVNNSGCASGDDFVACYTAYHHGFVITPRGSWAF
ncbi:MULTISPECIES: hypothetical protein [unclassified Mycolicibacterium]|uniref:hypothetical protein n=1 Tax=unclassified Mycolicibacterium TaxID=2636767 RepID=UPI0012DDF101|nr:MULTISPECIES: hypothetical protein [unclassified Mycolicibacterium]MUL85734.1 hypothetical protein [Mycolicibacterium sp. CBMA 329]MUL91611.1 hypothetical protein [Mycolicibacterium sp. CBMA 331]MUM02150.1 hypothetical protein [Mycolicibacterium sp. CBMA 334]MUM28830.1 hypothetical protein [Mycolicibacterium sp. CBMA 295]MUM41099.1 hypothetical protein [Mycolicibacterium sp. CBMA 247]